MVRDQVIPDAFSGSKIYTGLFAHPPLPYCVPLSLILACIPSFLFDSLPRFMAWETVEIRILSETFRSKALEFVEYLPFAGHFKCVKVKAHLNLKSPSKKRMIFFSKWGKRHSGGLIYWPFNQSGALTSICMCLALKACDFSPPCFLSVSWRERIYTEKNQKIRDKLWRNLSLESGLKNWEPGKIAKEGVKG